MNTLRFSTLARVAAAAGLALASLAAQADELSRTEQVRFSFDNEVQAFDLDIGSASDLRLWTATALSGSADPVLAFFDRGTGALLSLSDDVDAPYPQVDASQGLLDAGILITDLAAGAYRVAVSASPNLPVGSWADGYLNGTTGGNAMDALWTVRVELTHAAPIPEPTPTALLLAGLAAMSLVGRGLRRR